MSDTPVQPNGPEVPQTPGTNPTAPSQSAPQGGTATATRPPRMDSLPPFRVLLHNDDTSEAEWVVASIVELTPLRMERAMQAMIEAHKTGVSLLLVTHKERAELYQEQFKSKRLTVTIEPAG